MIYLLFIRFMQQSFAIYTAKKYHETAWGWFQD